MNDRRQAVDLAAGCGQRLTAVYATAVSLGRIVSELVINEHAFPKDSPDGHVVRNYHIDGSDLKLVVSDNGIGKPEAADIPAKGGLATAIVTALAQQLDAKVENLTQRFKSLVARAA